jgi:hypothetical protein
MMRRWSVCLLTLLLAAVVFGWIVYVPPAACNLFKPVPAHAQVVYSSAAPDWTVFDRLLFFQGLGNGGAKPFSFSSHFKNADGVFRLLEKAPLAVAFVPLGGRDRRDVWVAVSAIGPRALFLRWRLTLLPPAGLRPVRSRGAWPVWQYSNPSLPLWMRVRFAITEGLLICSISDDSHDIYYLLDTLDGRRPSLAERKER